MRKTRVIYVENDPALRGILSKQLSEHPDLELIASYESSESTLKNGKFKEVDVALLDLALGTESLNGTELGMLIREENPHIGIVIYSQHNSPSYLENLSEKVRWGWSFVEKRGDGEIDDLVNILISTSKGRSTFDVSNSHTEEDGDENPVAKLTLRQRQIMSLAATGMDANAIARQLDLAAITIRQELSRSYSILVPNPAEGTDLRTSAVLRYLREVRRDGEI
jgi:DNA-binding NarL/FixJ family response regulator